MERKTISQNKFIKKAQEIHNKQYDYSKVDYIKNTDKVIINCLIHGDFQQSPASHLRGSGCPECGKLKISAEKGKDTEYFIQKAKEVHGDKYDYSLVEYTKSKNKVKIICPEHGVFKQAAGSHLYGNGCSKCASSKILPKSTEQFIEEAVKLHEDKYEYKNSIYLSSKEKIIITCPLHGDFQQLPTSHLQGSGCPKCGRIEAGGFSRTKFIERAKGRLCIFYTLKCFNENEEFYKIGITMLTVEDRYNTIVRMPYLYEVISEIHGEAGAIWDMEKGEKRKLKKFRYQPTIHFAGSKTECFTQYKVNETK